MNNPYFTPKQMERKPMTRYVRTKETGDKVYLVENETYHWIIFTSGASMVDGSTVRLPAWGCYTLDGKDLEFNGVQPDILVINTFEDKINGRDLQLDKAIEEIMKQLK